VSSLERRERAAQEAAEWMISLQSPELSRAGRLEFVKWLRESPLHVAEMLRVAGAHKRLVDFNDWARMPPVDPSALEAEIHTLAVIGLPASPSDTPTRDLASRQRRQNISPWLTRCAAAAAIAVLVAVLTYSGVMNPRTIVADADHPKLVTLRDGTRVRLSPGSRLLARYTAHERDVLLSEGNALFTVAKDPSKPFIVQTGKTRVRAVGTVFGVERAGTSVIVTVQEGRIAVTNPSVSDESGSDPTLARALAPRVTEISLGADQQVIVPAAGAVGVVHTVDSHRELAWAEGRLIFDNAPVADVVRRFNQFNRTQLQVNDSELAAQPVTAVFDATDPEAFIVFLESVANVRITHTTSNEILIAPEGPR